MGMFNFVLDSFKGEIFDFKVNRRGLVASTVHQKSNITHDAFDFTIKLMHDSLFIKINIVDNF